MNWLLILQIIISVAIISIILLQPPTTSIGTSFGGGATRYHTKKGAEKFMFILTIILAFLFIVASLANIIL